VTVGLGSAYGNVHRPAGHRAAVRGESGRPWSSLRCRHQEVGAPKLEQQLSPGEGHRSAFPVHWAHTITDAPGSAVSPASGAVRTTRPMP
jgi:hypothetical protein